jgi:hypothetical protein
MSAISVESPPYLSTIYICLVIGLPVGITGLYKSMKGALYTLAGTGNPMDVLVEYCHLMRQRGVTRDAFTKTEEHHRDSIWITILENPAIKPMAEYQVRKWTQNMGFIDLLITDNKCRRKNIFPAGLAAVETPRCGSLRHHHHRPINIISNGPAG